MLQAEEIEKVDKSLEKVIKQILEMYKNFGKEYNYIMEIYIYDCLGVTYCKSKYKPITIKDLSETIRKLYFNNPKVNNTETLNEEELNQYIEKIFKNENTKKIVITITVEKRLLEIIKTIVFDEKEVYLLLTNGKKTMDINKGDMILWL